VWFEPAAEVTYSTPPPLPSSDIPYFLLRWSESWTEQSLRHFCAKHGIDPAYANRAKIIRQRRQIVFQPARRVTRRLLGHRSDAALGRALAAVEHRLNRALVRAS